MISASHNPIGDNGIKFFGADGFKLSDDLEDEIEAAARTRRLPRPTGTGVGIARAPQNSASTTTTSSRTGADLTRPARRRRCSVRCGVRGRAVRAAQARRRRDRDQCENDGCAHQRRLRCDGSGAAAGRGRARETRRRSPVVGVAFDGDADRAMFVDETGAILTGDHVMFAIGGAMHDAANLRATRSSER